ADDAPSLWRNVLSGVRAIGDLPLSRWDVDKLMGSGDAGAVLQTKLAGTVRLPPMKGPRPSAPTIPLEEADPAIALSLAASAEALADVSSLEQARTMVAI